ncbi:MAG: hypothetical protein IJ087_12950 [Eggerthellaceae bacterium]|nr:hypothetical protein [Eggerthellaceae bacterium]
MTDVRDAAYTEMERLPIGLSLCQAYFVFAMLLALVFGFLCSPHMFDYDVSMVRVLLLMMGGTVTLWLVSRRMRAARAVGAATALACAGLSIVDHAAFGAYETLSGYVGQPVVTALMFLECAGAVAVALYLAFAPGAKRTLFLKLDMSPAATDGHSWDVPLRVLERTRVF